MTLALAIALSLCPAHGIRRDCVVDGDSLWVGRERIRIAAIDAPEIGDAKCPAELARGIRARDRLLDLTRGGYRFERLGLDRHGRTLARVTVNGRDIGEQLVREGLARPWTGKRLPWC